MGQYQNFNFDTNSSLQVFLADRKKVTVELLAWLSFVCPFFRLSVSPFVCNGCIVAKR